MSQIFPEWTNKLPVLSAAAILVVVLGAVGFSWYYGSPWYTDVGYRPVQPVPYSHKLHADDLGLDCRYCHNYAEVSAHANVPPTQTCMNCHRLILTDSERLLPVRESFSRKQPLQWVRVHKVADYCYFDHSVHLAAGVGCATCHGNVAEMEVVTQTQPLSMGWCLSCHRYPDPFLRPREELTDMRWSPPPDHATYAAVVKRDRNITPPEDCSGCHR